MQVNDTLTLESIPVPPKVKLLGDPETVIATLTPPRLQVEAEEEIETETEVVGEGEAAEAGAGEAAEGGGEESRGGDGSGGE
jgi:large subunit ribosomal protein L25